MPLPKWLCAAIAFLVALAAVGFLPKLQSPTTLQAIGNAAIILTLAILLVYTYCTYLLAKDAWLVSASFSLEQRTEGWREINFMIQNHSKFSIECWCNLHAMVDGQRVSLGGFYSGETTWAIQPLGSGIGHFSLDALLGKASQRFDQMRSKAVSSDAGRRLLCLDIGFSYRPVGLTTKSIKNPRQRYYYDFNRRIMVLDV